MLGAAEEWTPGPAGQAAQGEGHDAAARSTRGPNLQPRPQAAATRSPRPAGPVLYTHLSPPGCRPPWLPSGFRRRHRRREASRAGAAAAAAGARVRPSVRPAGRALRPDLLHSAPTSTLPPVLWFSSRLTSDSAGFNLSVGDSATPETRGRREKQMATAGGAKMEPASCAKQSRSRNALRCLRSVPLAERHSAEHRGGSGGGDGSEGEKRDGRGVVSVRRTAPRNLDVQGTSLLPEDKWYLGFAALLPISRVRAESYLKRLVGLEWLM